MNTKTSQGSAMFLIILVVVILGVVIISFVKIPNFPSFLKPAPTSEPIKRDQSLEDYLKNKFGLCVEYLGENTCTPQNTKTAPPGNINSGEPLVISIQVVSGDFALINLTSGPAVVQKQNGSWSIIYEGGGGIPDCSEIENIPPGTFGEDNLNACYNGSETIVRTTGEPI